MKLLRDVIRLSLLQKSRLVSQRRYSSNCSAMKIGIIQMTSTSDKTDNFRKCQEMIMKSKSEGAKMVFLPEAFDFIGSSSAQTLELAEPLEGPLITEYKNLAKRENLWLSLGGFHRRLSEAEERVSNCHVVVNQVGEIAATYEKAHLFDADIPGKVQLTESRYVRPGQAMPPVIPTPVGNVGLAVCYDIRFPELSLGLREAGAELITYPSAFSQPTGEAGHWEVLLRARAIEAQCYVVAAAQCGRHNDRRTSYGQSMLIDPWGQIVCDLGAEEEMCVTVELDVEKIASVRQNMPLAKQRRHDLYPTMTLQAQYPDLENDYWFGEHRISGKHVFFCSQQSFAFVNLSPVVSGHMLVAPVKVAPRLTDMTEAEICDLYRTAHRVVQKVEAYYGTTSATVVCQDGPEAGQTVKHVHIHILPRRKDDFVKNDQIYEELEERTKTPRVKRTFEEMAVEAKTFRDLFF